MKNSSAVLFPQEIKANTGQGKGSSINYVMFLQSGFLEFDFPIIRLVIKFGIMLFGYISNFGNQVCK